MNKIAATRYFALPIFLCLFFSLLATAQTVAELPEQWQSWLEDDVRWIISEKEELILIQLDSEEKRQLFRKHFWLNRDPTPGTERNERQEQHLERLEHVNKFFGRGTLKKPMLTAFARYYMIFGPPRDIQRFEGNGQVFTSQLWMYQADPATGVPPFFYLLFFKKHGFGDYVLYSPIIDGPKALLTTQQNVSPEEQFRTLATVNPELASASYSFLPDERPSRNFSTPSMSTLTLMAKVHNLRNTNVDDSYADLILQGVELVDTQYSFNETLLPLISSVNNSTPGINTVSFAIQLLPEQLNFGQYDDTYYSSLQLNAQISNEDGITINELDKKLDFEMDKARFDEIKHSSFIINGVMLATPGKNRLSIRLRNPLLKQYYMISQEIFVPAAETSTLTAGKLIPAISMTQNSANQLDPFKFENITFEVRPIPVFGPEQTIYFYCPIQIPTDMHADQLPMLLEVTDASGAKVISQEMQLDCSRASSNGLLMLGGALPEKIPQEGSYSARVTFKTEVPQVRSFDFLVSNDPLPAPVIRTAQSLDFGKPETLERFGEMMLNIGNREAAYQAFNKIVELEQDNIKALEQVVELASDLSQKESIVKRLEILLITSPRNSDLLLLQGKALLAAAQPVKAIRFLERLHFENEPTAASLNLLATAYHQNGELDKAVDAWEKSLEINPRQDDVIAIIKSLQSESPAIQ
jgi:GWxTD domain-containing protein